VPPGACIYAALLVDSRTDCICRSQARSWFQLGTVRDVDHWTKPVSKPSGFGIAAERIPVGYAATSLPTYLPASILSKPVGTIPYGLVSVEKPAIKAHGDIETKMHLSRGIAKVSPKLARDHVHLSETLERMECQFEFVVIEPFLIALNTPSVGRLLASCWEECCSTAKVVSRPAPTFLQLLSVVHGWLITDIPTDSVTSNKRSR
jgi:hypothetical protein